VKLITVRCWRRQDQEVDEHRLGVAIATSPAEAEKLCEIAYRAEGYERFQSDETVEGHFDGPARVIGYAGQTGWK